MVITEVRIKLMEDNNENERLQAFCSVTFDDAFVVRDLKIIEGTKGSFVAMPSRKLTDRCPQCGSKNHLRGRFCNQCGGRLDEDRATRDADGRAKLHADIAHPINSACREVMQSAIIRAFNDEKERAKLPDRQRCLAVVVAERQRALRWALKQIEPHGVAQLIRCVADVEGGRGVAPRAALDGDDVEPMIGEFVAQNGAGPTETDDHHILRRQLCSHNENPMSKTYLEPDADQSLRPRIDTGGSG